MFHCFGFVLLLLVLVLFCFFCFRFFSFVFLLCFLFCFVLFLFLFFSEKLSRWQDKIILITICNRTVLSKVKVKGKTKWEKGLKAKRLRDEQAKRNVSIVP